MTKRGPQYTDDVKLAAKELYLKGYGGLRTAAELKSAGFNPSPDRNTVDLWVKRGNWGELRREIRKKKDKMLVTTLAQVNKMHFDTAQEVIDKAMQVLRSDEMDLSASDIERMAKLQRLIFGEATERTAIQPTTIEMPAWFNPKKEKQNETKTEEAKC